MRIQVLGLPFTAVFHNGAINTQPENCERFSPKHSKRDAADARCITIMIPVDLDSQIRNLG